LGCEQRLHRILPDFVDEAASLSIRLQSVDRLMQRQFSGATEAGSRPCTELETLDAIITSFR
jgi:hypothetical protein